MKFSGIIIAIGMTMVSAVAATFDCNGAQWDSYEGKPVTRINGYVEESTEAPGNTGYDCCVSCVNEPGCAYSVFSGGVCTIGIIGAGCKESTVSGQFFVSDSGPAFGVISNSPCGHLVYGGDDH